MMDFCLENNAFNLQNITTLDQSSVLHCKCQFFYCIIKYKTVSKKHKVIKLNWVHDLKREVGKLAKVIKLIWVSGHEFGDLTQVIF
jgi:hypothetical protein